MLKAVIGMIVLNEEEFILKNLHQHYNWKGMDIVQIVIIEGSVKLFPQRNLNNGRSSDRTIELIEQFPDVEKKITLIGGVWDDKSHQRNQYANWINEYVRAGNQVDMLIVIDCDEFYTFKNQEKISKIIEENPDKHSFLVPQKHLWHTDKLQVVGGYWNVSHLRFYRWKLGCHYEKNHNEVVGSDGHNYHVRDSGFYKCFDVYCVHYGFYRSSKFVRDKQDYYYNRGEKVTRPMYSDCREAWFNWKEGDILPHGARVIPYDGELPEVFR